MWKSYVCIYPWNSINDDLSADNFFARCSQLWTMLINGYFFQNWFIDDYLFSINFSIDANKFQIQKSTENINQKKLVAKATQFGLAGTFIVIILMTFLTIQSSFAYKYFIATIIYCALGGIASILFICKIKNFYLDQNSQQAIES